MARRLTKELEDLMPRGPDVSLGLHGHLEVDEGDLSDITALLPTSEQMDTAVRSGCICAEATEWMPLAMAMAGEEIPVDGAPNPPPIADGGEPPMTGGANTYLVLVQYIETEFGCSCTRSSNPDTAVYTCDACTQGSTCSSPSIDSFPCDTATCASGVWTVSGGTDPDCDSVDFDPDSDGDGASDEGDEFPNDPSQIGDTDNDGYGDLASGEQPDACPGTAGTSTLDRYGCPDSDGDGQSDSPQEWCSWY